MPESSAAIHKKSERSLYLLMYLLIFAVFFAITFVGVIYLFPILGIFVPIVVGILVFIMVVGKIIYKVDIFTWIVWEIRNFLKPAGQQGKTYDQATQDLVDMLESMLMRWVASQLLWIIVIIVFRFDLFLGRYTFFFTFVPSIMFLVLITVRERVKMMKEGRKYQ